MLEEVRQESGDFSTVRGVIDDYLTEVDGRLIERGWGFVGAKTVEFDYHDQSLLNHVRNGVFFLCRLNHVAEELGVRTLTDAELRKAVGMFVAHDLHKTRETNAEGEFDIPRSTVADFVEEAGLGSLAPELTVDDYWSCACAHHDTWNAKSERVTIAFTELQAHVRFADAFASTAVPEDAVDERMLEAVDDVFYGEVDLHYHQLTDVKGVLTNLLNTSVADRLQHNGYELLAIYQDGCVYASESGAERPSLDEAFLTELYKTFTETVQSSHPSYRNPVKLMENIETGRLGYYDPSPQDFFYAGAENVLEAMVRKAAADGDTEDDPTDSMSESITKVAAEVPVDLDDTRQLVGAARLVYGVHRTIVPELDAETDDFDITCDLFGVSDAVETALKETRERDPKHLKSGGKWEYSYAIGQELLSREFDGLPAKRLSTSEFSDAVYQFLLSRLKEYEGWESVAESFTADIRTEMRAYLTDALIVDGGPIRPHDTGLTDPYEQYVSKRGGKLCTLCNRGTTSTRKSDMEVKKSVSTLQAGFSNRTRAGAGKPEQLLMCAPCRIEFSLRETGGSRRDAGRLFFHFAPDYFFTPLMWRLTEQLFSYYKGDKRVQIGRIAEQVFNDDHETEVYERVQEYLTTEDGGRPMVENLGSGFEEGFGAMQFGYFKQQENDTEFQFFGVYLALVISAYTGLRVLVSENPVPDIRGRDFREMARLGAGLSPVTRFYGDEVRLTDLERTLKRSSALIQLGYAIERSDSLFAKHLRTTRNEPLPGSALLKRIVRDDPDEGSRVAWNLMDEAKYLDMARGW
jgi:CRISPR-associated protein Csc3